MSASEFLLTPVHGSHGSLRLFCFPHAGGGASAYWSWIGALGPRVEVAPVQLPGRETRRRAAPFPDWNALVNDLIHGLAPFLEPPFAFFGHSFGAFVAFEVARGLARRGAPMTDCLLVSAARAPHLPDPDPSIQRLPDADFIERLRRLNGIPDQVLGNKELLDIFLPTIRSDLALLDAYRYREEPPLACQIVAFGGSDDKKVGAEDLEGWARQTSRRFAIRRFPGGHFFLTTARDSLLRAVQEELEALRGFDIGDQ
jgi:medium-chain acyl-[acyl-carrier-protein] hydrolase